MRKIMPTFISALLMISLTAFQGAAAQEQKKQEPKEADAQDKPLQLKSDLIEVRAVVTDKKGNPITDLKKEDFELFENNKAQPINFFSVEQVDAGPARPAVSTPEAARAVTNFTPQRTIILFVDTFNLAAADMSLVKKGLKKFIDEQMAERDLVAIVTSSGMLGVMEQFTRDRNLLRMAVDRLRPLHINRFELFSPYVAAEVIREEVSPGEATNFLIQYFVSTEGPLPTREQELQRASSRSRSLLNIASAERKRTLSVIDAVVERLAALPGQRLLAYLSPGFTMRADGTGFDTTQLEHITSRAVRSGIVIYSLDAAGLAPPAMFSAQMSGPMTPSATRLTFEAEKDAQNVLNAISKDTGGEFFRNTNDLGSGLKKALDANRTFYALAYYPVLEAGDDKFRKIEVKVKGHPEYEVRAQRGYSPAALLKKSEKEQALTPEQRVVKAMASPLPVTDIGVIASATVVRAEGEGATVALQSYIEAEVLDYKQQGENEAFDVELYTSVFDATGKQVNGFKEKIQGTLSKARSQQAKANGFTHVRRVVLKPGLYNVRVGVKEPSSERMGTAIAWVEVPEVKKTKLAMGGIVLSEALASPQGAAGPAGKVEIVLPNMVGGMQVYKRGGQLLFGAVVFAEAAEKTDGGNILVEVEILSGGDSVYKTGAQPVTAWVTGKEKRAMQIGGQIPLQMPAGVYELRVVVKEAKGKRSALQSVVFRVDP